MSEFSSFSEEGSNLVGMSSRDSGVLYQRRLVHRLNDHEGAVLYCAVDQKEKILATCSDDGKIILWTIATGDILRILSGGHTGKVTSCAFCSIGPILASSSEDKKVILWHHDTGKRASRLGKGKVSVFTDHNNNNNILFTVQHGYFALKDRTQVYTNLVTATIPASILRILNLILFNCKPIKPGLY